MGLPGAMKDYEGIHMGICMAGWLVDTQHSPYSWKSVELQEGARIHQLPQQAHL